MPDVKVGDEVRVFERSYRRSRTPDEGWPGTVTKTGRKYATAVYQYTYERDGTQKTRERSIEFDMVTGYERGAVGNYSARVRTPWQVEQDNRRSAALSVLREAGIEIKPGRERYLTLEQIEALAEVAKTFGQED